MSQQAVPIMPLYALIGLLALGGFFFVVLGGTVPGVSGDTEVCDGCGEVQPDVPSNIETRVQPVGNVSGVVYDFNSEIVCNMTVKNWGTGNDPAVNNPEGKIGLELNIDESMCWVARNNGCSTSEWAMKYLSGVTTTKQHGKLTTTIFYPLGTRTDVLSISQVYPLTIYSDGEPSILPGFSKTIRATECLPHMNWWEGTVHLSRYEFTSEPSFECLRQSIVNVYPQAVAPGARDRWIVTEDGETVGGASGVEGILEDEDLEFDSEHCGMSLNLASPPGFTFMACSPEPEERELAESITGRKCGITEIK